MTLCMRMGQYSPCVEMGKKTPMEYGCECQKGVVGEWREWEIASLPTRREDEEFAGGVGTWERTDSLAMPTTTQQ